MAEEPEPKRRGTYRKWKEATDASNFGWLANMAVAAFAGYLIAKRDSASEILGIGSPALWKMLLVVTGLLFAGGIAMSVATGIARKHTGVVYAEDRLAFARLGGLDAGRVPMLVVQLALFGAYWLTSKMADDPIAIGRNPWAFLLGSTAIGLATTKVVAERVFRRHAAPGSRDRLARGSRLPRVGIRITHLTPDRLELTHGTMLFRALGVAFCYGTALAVYLGAGLTSEAGEELFGPTATKWGAISLALAVGSGLLLVTSDRRVVIDKRAGYLETRDRYAWGKISVRRLRLETVTAIVASRQTAGASQLTNVLARSAQSTFPVIIGSRLAANAHEHALVIGRFLDVPVYEDERLLAVSPEQSVADILDVIESAKREARRERLDT